MKIKYKRLVAYIIDSFIISLVVSLFAASSIMQKSMNKYNDASERLTIYYNEILESEDINIKDMENELKYMLYDINYFGIPYASLQIASIILYYVVFQFFNKGQTIGKKLMKIKVVDKNGNDLSLGNMLLRNIFLYNILFSIITLLVASFTSVNVFLIITLALNSINSIISLLIVFMILFRKDERGLHDLIASSKVVEI